MSGRDLFLRDIVSHKSTPDGIAAEVVLSCGHKTILIGDMNNLVAMYGRLASQCAECLNEWVAQYRSGEQS